MFLPGFSIDSGLALLRQGELTIVSGAPRGGYGGQVTFLRQDPLADDNLSVELVLSGPSLASSYGYALAVVDLNSDGYVQFQVTYASYSQQIQQKLFEFFWHRLSIINRRFFSGFVWFASASMCIRL